LFEGGFQKSLTISWSRNVWIGTFSEPTKQYGRQALLKGNNELALAIFYGVVRRPAAVDQDQRDVIENVFSTPIPTVRA
jgi:hypothetical protein